MRMSDDSLLFSTRAILQDGIDHRIHLGAQLYVSRLGNVIADLTLGESRPGVPMRTDTINLWMSSGKPITAVAVVQLWEQGKLDLDDPIAKYVPEFAVRGKDSITIRQVLTHTGGFRAAGDLRWNDPFDVAVEKVCKAALEPRWIPGETAGYHAATAWYILAEIVRRREGRPFDQYVREAIFLPLGMNDSWIGLPPHAYQKYGDRIGFLYNTSKGSPDENVPGNSEADAAAIRPGANARGPINQLGLFYETLLKNDGRLLRPQTVEAMTSRQRIGKYDLTFKHVMDWGLGFIINSNQYGVETVPYGYGKYAGPRTFGHSGQESSCAFCDPDAGLVVAWACNGMPGGAKHHLRQRRINEAIYEDLKILNDQIPMSDK